MKKVSTIVFFCSVILSSRAQVGINTDASLPDASAMLDVKSTNKGMLVPRVTTVQRTTNIASPADGLLVYDTNTKTFWFYKTGTGWTEINTTGLTLPFSGSSSTNGISFLAINNGSLGGALSGQAYGSGPGVLGSSETGVGGQFSSTSGVALKTTQGRTELNGSLKIIDGTQGTGKVLTSDANGLASWITPAATASVWTASGNNIYNANSGLVGVGTNSPAYLLDVNNRMRIRHNGVNTAGIWFNKADNTEATFTGMYNDSTFGYFGNGTVGNWRVGIDVKNAMMGIGTMTPTAPLTFGNGGGNKIDFYNTSSTDRYGIGIQTALFQFYSGGHFAFGRGTGAGFAERLRINVTTAAGETPATLQVARGTGLNGTAQFDGTTNISHFNYGTVEDTYIRGGKSTSRVVINDQASGNVLISPGSGNVGIGNSNPLYKLDVTGNFQTSGVALIGGPLTAPSLNTTTGTAITNNLSLPGNATIGGLIRIAGGSPTNRDVLTAIDGAGNAVWTKPAISGSAFQATLGNSNQALVQGQNRIAFAVNDIYGVFSDGWDNNTHTFIAEESGVYHFEAHVYFAQEGSVLNYGGPIKLTAWQDNNFIIATTYDHVKTAGDYVKASVTFNVLLNLNETIDFRLEVPFCCGPYSLWKDQTSASGFRLY